MNLSKLKDFFTLIILACFFLGCYATTHRGARTLDPGKVSAAGSYMRFTSTESNGDPGKLLGIEARAGLLKGIDAGIIRTFDITEGVESDEKIDTWWLDTKFQLTNREKLLKKLTISLGYGFGYVVEFEDTWVNTMYLIAGTELAKLDMFYSFRYENIDEGINPFWIFDTGFNEARKAHIIGLEYQLNYNLRPVIELGRFYDENFNDGLNVITAGVNFYFN
jgi:hypothetical protein